VADFQIRIAELVAPVQTLDTDLHSQAAFPHLQRLHLLPFAYAATVIEVLRRKEFAVALKAWTDRLSSSFAKFTELEGSRRREIKADVTSQLPFSVPALDDILPKIELSVVTGSDGVAALGVTQEDVTGKSAEVVAEPADSEDIRRWIKSLKEDKELHVAIIDQESDPIPFLEHGVEDLISKMGEATQELDQMMERSGTFVSRRG
jgi:autophagy-related protein 11